jgi:hypothetical protein
VMSDTMLCDLYMHRCGEKAIQQATWNLPDDDVCSCDCLSECYTVGHV